MSIKNVLAGLILVGNVSTLWAQKKAMSAADAQAMPGKSTVSIPSAAIGLSSTGSLLDSFETLDWNSANHEATAISLGQAPGMEGQSLWISYDLKDSKQWVAVSKPFDAGDFQGKALDFWIKGKGKSNILEVKLVDADGSNFGVKKPGLTNKAEWTRQTINEPEFTYWWGGDKSLGPIKEVHFAISAEQGGAGDVQIDQLRLIPAKQAELPKGGVLSDGESTEGWIPAQAEGAKLTLGNEPGQKGNAVVLSYSLPANQWVSVRRTVNLNLAPTATLVLSLKGQGDPNNVEIKVVDRDESNFGKILEQQAGINAWQEVRLPLSELTYLWGGDNKLDSTLIRHIDIAVSGAGGKGKVYIDDLKVIP